MRILFATFISIIAVEYCFRVPLLQCSKTLIQVAGRSANLIRSKKISDHWKEIALIRYSCILFRQTFFLAVILIGFCFVVFLMAKLADHMFGFAESILTIYFDPSGLFVIMIVTLVYANVRQRFK